MPNKSNNSSIIIIMIICVVVILLIAGGIYFYINYNQNPTTENQTVSVPQSNILQEKFKWGFVKNSAKGNCLAVIGLGQPNDNVALGNCTGEDNQLWELTDKMTLLHYPDKLCLDPAGYDASKGVNVGLYSCDQGSEPGGDQTWNIDSVDDSKFRFINQKSNLCLDVASITGDAGANVLIGDCKNTLNQQWMFVPTPKNLF